MSEMFMNDIEEIEYGAQKQVYIAKRDVNLREEPNLNANILKVIKKGEQLEGINIGDWIACARGFSMRKYYE